MKGFMKKLTGGAQSRTTRAQPSEREVRKAIVRLAMDARDDLINLKDKQEELSKVVEYNSRLQPSAQVPQYIKDQRTAYGMELAEEVKEAQEKYNDLCPQALDARDEAARDALPNASPTKQAALQLLLRERALPENDSSDGEDLF